MPEGIDYAFGRPAVAELRDAGVRFVCRYMSHSPSKNLTAAEARELSDAGIWVVVVWETTAQRALDGHAAGIDDAMDAQRQALACGMPSDRPIYFAVDWDATSGQQAAINAYLDGAGSVLGWGRVGIYGGYGPVKRALDAGKAHWAWQTYAWSGGRWDPRAQLQQYSNGHTLGGVGCDYDRATTSDYGQWRVGVTPDLQEDDMAQVTSVGAEKTATPQTIPANSTDGVAIRWDTQFTDHHDLFKPDKDGGAYSIVILDKTDGSLWAICDALFELHGLKPGDGVTISWDRMKPPAKDGDPWQLSDNAWDKPFYADKNGVIRDELHGQFGLDASVRLRLRVYNPNPYPITVIGRDADGRPRTMAKISLFKY